MNLVKKKKEKKWGPKLYKTLQNSLRLNCRLLNLFHVKILKLFEKRPFLMDWEFLVAFLKTQKNGHFSKTGISNFAQKGVFFIYICHIFQQPFSKMNNFQMKILNKSENFTLIVYIIYIYIYTYNFIYIQGGQRSLNFLNSLKTAEIFLSVKKVP